MKLLIDADILLYRCGFAAQSDNDDPPIEHSLGNIKKAVIGIEEKMSEYFTVEGKTLFLSPDGKQNFRYSVAKTQPYKGNRTQPKPKHFAEMKEYIQKKYNHVMAVDEEADDAIGKASSRLRDKCVIISADKDLRMLPGWHWEMNEYEYPFYATEYGHLALQKRKGKRLQLVGTGYMWFYAQMLLGDKVDNIQGVKGCGDKKTFELLGHAKGIGELERVVKEQYKKAGMSEAQYEENKQLLWIRR